MIGEYMSSFLFDPIPKVQTAAGITALFTDAMAKAEQLATSIRDQKDHEDSLLTWESTFGAFDRVNACIQEAICIPQLMSVTHPDAAVRDAAKAAEPLVDAFASQLLLDDAIASVLERAAAVIPPPFMGESEGAKGRARFIEQVLRDYRRNGLSLSEPDRVMLRSLNEQMTKLSQSFDTNLAETTLSMTVTPEQLDGLPESFIANHPSDANGAVTLTTDYPDLIPVLEYATHRDVARELYRLSDVRAAEKNIPILN